MGLIRTHISIRDPFCIYESNVIYGTEGCRHQSYLRLCTIVRVYKYRITCCSQFQRARGSFVVIIRLNKKNHNSQPKKTKVQKSANHPPAKAGLGRNLLTSGAGALGGWLGGPLGSSLASQGAGWLSDILGMGDYDIKGNSLMKGTTGVPTFSESAHTVRIRHREYLGDITGSTGFSVRSYSINPGLEATFPWLSNVAYAYQQYKLHGCLFEFVSTSADALNSVNTALGTVIMSTQYNSTLPSFSNKAEMEQYEYSCSSKPSCSLIHPVECDPDFNVLQHLYVRGGAVPAGTDARLYDLGNFQLATVGMQAAATIGELWVTYDVEFFKPRIQPGGAYPGQFTRISNGPYAAASNVLGSIQTTPAGSLGCTVSSVTTGWDSIFFPSTITAGRFFIEVLWQGSVAANCTFSSPSLSNLSFTNGFNLASVPWVVSPDSGTNNSTRSLFSAVVTVNGYNVNGSTITFSSANTLPATPTHLTIYVVALPLTDSYV